MGCGASKAALTVQATAPTTPPPEKSDNKPHAARVEAHPHAPAAAAQKTEPAASKAPVQAQPQPLPAVVVREASDGVAKIMESEQKNVEQEKDNKSQVSPVNFIHHQIPNLRVTTAAHTDVACDPTSGLPTPSEPVILELTDTPGLIWDCGLPTLPTRLLASATSSGAVDLQFSRAPSGPWTTVTRISLAAGASTIDLIPPPSDSAPPPCARFWALRAAASPVALSKLALHGSRLPAPAPRSVSVTPDGTVAWKYPVDVNAAGVTGFTVVFNGGTAMAISVAEAKTHEKGVFKVNVGTVDLSKGVLLMAQREADISVVSGVPATLGPAAGAASPNATPAIHHKQLKGLRVAAANVSGKAPAVWDGGEEITFADGVHEGKPHIVLDFGLPSALTKVEVTRGGNGVGEVRVLAGRTEDGPWTVLTQVSGSGTRYFVGDAAMDVATSGGSAGVDSGSGNAGSTCARFFGISGTTGDTIGVRFFGVKVPLPGPKDVVFERGDPGTSRVWWKYHGGYKVDGFYVLRGGLGLEVSGKVAAGWVEYVAEIGGHGDDVTVVARQGAELGLLARARVEG